jgi:putative photosynthetic complex assembly protein
MLIAVASLIGFTILAVAVARLTGFDPSQAPVSPEVAVRDLNFVEIGQGDLAVYDAESGVLLETLPPGEDGFIRGVLRTLERERRMHGVALDGPYRVSLRENGRFTLGGSNDRLLHRPQGLRPDQRGRRRPIPVGTADGSVRLRCGVGGERRPPPAAVAAKRTMRRPLACYDPGSSTSTFRVRRIGSIRAAIASVDPRSGDLARSFAARAGVIPEAEAFRSPSARE